MGPFLVSQIELNQDDAYGLKVQSIYARFDPRYAVYRTVERVAIQFADDPRLESEQREKMARLSPLRGEINGLVDGWRTSSRNRHKSAALRYDRRVADALIVALEGDVDSASTILSQIRDDVVAERKSIARFKYLVCAAATAIVLGLGAAFATSDFAQAHALFMPYDPYTANTWLAVAAGTLGAFFSIARGISSRSIHTDLQMLDNIVDAMLRVLIGAIAAVVLQALLDANLFSISLGGAVLGAKDWPGPDDVVRHITPPLVLLVAAFVAGFSERLIPDLLDSASLPTSDKPQTAPPPASKPEENKTKKDDGEGRSATPDALGAGQVEGQAHAEEKVDGCDVDASNSDVPPTPDDRLPAASGGVVNR